MQLFACPKSCEVWLLDKEDICDIGQGCHADLEKVELVVDQNPLDQPPQLAPSFQCFPFPKEDVKIMFC